MEFKIETGIPLPASTSRGPRVDYPFSKMEPGQSIFVPGKTVKQMTGQLGFWKKQGMVFTLSATTADVLDAETGEMTQADGVRIWVRDPSEKSNRGRKPAVKPTENTEGEAQTEGEGEAATENTEGEAATENADAPEAGNTTGKKKKPAKVEDEY